MLNDEQLRRLARALATRPRASLSELAIAAGFSRSTLYRFAPNRQAVIEVLTEAALLRIANTLAKELAGSAYSDDPGLYLVGMTEALVEDLDLFVFLFHRFAGDGEHGNVYHEPPEWSAINVVLEQYFLEGQKRGSFLLQLPATWLSDLYWSCLYGASWSIAHGRLGPAAAATMVTSSFLYGVSARRSPLAINALPPSKRGDQ